MSGGWGTPRPTANPERVRAGMELLTNVVTGRCNDGYHDDCHGHLLGVPCSCPCHTANEETATDGT